MKSLILDLHNKLIGGEVKPLVLLENSKKAYEAIKDCNTSITPLFDTHKELSFDAKNLLSCIPYSLKDNITTANIRTTGGSKFLSNFTPVYSSNAYELINAQGAVLVSKDNMDEFGLGGTGTFSAYGIVHNPLDTKRATGGSSSGSAANVAAGVSVFALGTDTGDSIRRPASYLGIVGYKPTYGAISRYGVYPYAPSLDHVGVLSKYVADATIVASTVIKHDERDLTSTNLIKDVKLENLKTQEKIKFVVIKNVLDLLPAEYKNKFDELLTSLKAKGHEIVYGDLDMDILLGTSFTYRTISFTEATSCWYNIQGFTFGNDVSNENDKFFETIKKNRTEGLGVEVKKRFTYGAYLSWSRNFYTNLMLAKKIRAAAIKAEEELLKLGDCILMPSLHAVAPLIADAKSSNLYDDWLELANFSGTPSITIPFTKFNGLPYGITLSANVYEDMKLLNIAYTLEEMMGGK